MRNAAALKEGTARDTFLKALVDLTKDGVGKTRKTCNFRCNFHNECNGAFITRDKSKRG